jgi:hypothetical protein
MRIVVIINRQKGEALLPHRQQEMKAYKGCGSSQALHTGL